MNESYLDLISTFALVFWEGLASTLGLVLVFLFDLLLSGPFKLFLGTLV